jgi:hypothetical protein
VTNGTNGTVAVNCHPSSGPKSVATGCNGYFEKPIDPLTIIAQIHELRQILNNRLTGSGTLGSTAGGTTINPGATLRLFADEFRTPVSVVGGEESIVSVYDARGLAKMLGAPYLPVSQCVFGTIGSVRCWRNQDASVNMARFLQGRKARHVSRTLHAGAT